MSNRVNTPYSSWVLPLSWVCPQFARLSGGLVAPLAWANQSLSIGTANSSCYTSLTSPCIPNAAGAFTCPNNATRINWSAGNWVATRAPGAMFGANDAAGPFTSSTGTYYDTTTSLARVNARVQASPITESLYPFTEPTWPVWLARGLGASMDIPTGSISIDTTPFNGTQAQYMWGLTDGMIVHPDHQERVAKWITPLGSDFPVSLCVPNTATSVSIGGRVPNAYIGTVDGYTAEQADGLVIDLSNWMPKPMGSLALGGFNIRS